MSFFPRAVIFDCDGVLVNSEPISCKVITEMAQELGIPVTLDFIEQSFTGNSWKNNKATLEELGGQPLPEDFFANYRQRSFAAFEKELQPVAGIPELVKNLELPFAVASSGPPNKIRWNLDIINLRSYFEGRIFSCWDIDRFKPDPAIYLLAAEHLKVKPKDCIVIEDSQSGVKAGIAGGFKTYAYCSPAKKSEMEALGATVIHDMRELYPILIDRKKIKYWNG